MLKRLAFALFCERNFEVGRLRVGALEVTLFGNFTPKKHTKGSREAAFGLFEILVAFR